MAQLRYRFMKKGVGVGHGLPINMAFVDKKDLESEGIDEHTAITSIARHVNAPVGINVFDMDAITTTSDGIVVDGAIILMAAGDIGRIHPEFGHLHMHEIPVTQELVGEEPHLGQIRHGFRGRKLFRGPDPKEKIIPVHNVVMTGRAVNNNSATEVMDAVSMQEMLLPILGQLQVMKDGDVMFGITGEVISVGIGMTVAEMYGRVFPTRQFAAGQTAHGSGSYAKTLKAHIPCMVAPKSVLAEYTIRALEAGMVPGLHIGCSPAVLALAHVMGFPVAKDNIDCKAREELMSIGIDVDKVGEGSPRISRSEAIRRADEIIPGVVDPVVYHSRDIVSKETMTV
ncbi:MAG TPA: hypothetical protein PLT03_07260 [Bacillota bacterium]|nr:hypothetical protein [Bacillota bacterium]HOA16158.1 hypothetical protein [Bacillota bacterium]HOG53656.1 hypothetical protein [Bacillota bacterium]